MARYSGLTSYLRSIRTETVPMTFSEIENVIGRRLPTSAVSHRAWWSNNPTNNVMTRAWLDAGFRSEQVDMEGHRLVFRRILGDTPAAPAAGAPVHSGSPSDEPLRGLYGGLSDTLTVQAGTDLTAPTAEDWRAEH